MIAEPLSRSVWARSRWLVLAPHPDDETLGAGALLRHAFNEGMLGGVAYLTDGTGSHPEGTSGLAIARRREAAAAVRRLTGACVPIDWLGWKDARPEAPDSAGFQRSADRLAALLRRRRIDAIAVTDRTEAHCDHVAAFRLVMEATKRARRSIAVFAYHVWTARAEPSPRWIATAAMPPGVRRHALRAHRSQISPLFGDGFRLPAGRLRMRSTDILALRRRG